MESRALVEYVQPFSFLHLKRERTETQVERSKRLGTGDRRCCRPGPRHCASARPSPRPSPQAHELTCTLAPGGGQREPGLRPPIGPCSREGRPGLSPGRDQGAFPRQSFASSPRKSLSHQSPLIPVKCLKHPVTLLLGTHSPRPPPSALHRCAPAGAGVRKCAQAQLWGPPALAPPTPSLRFSSSFFFFLSPRTFSVQGCTLCKFEIIILHCFLLLHAEERKGQGARDCFKAMIVNIWNSHPNPRPRAPSTAPLSFFASAGVTLRILCEPGKPLPPSCTPGCCFHFYANVPGPLTSLSVVL